MEGYVPLIHYLLSHGANPNAFARTGSDSFGTGLDLFATGLLNCEFNSQLFRREYSWVNHGARIYDTLVAWGGEFSRPFPSTYELVPEAGLVLNSFRSFATNVIQLQLFPEQIDCKMFPTAQWKDLPLIFMGEIPSVRSRTSGIVNPVKAAG